MQGKEYNLLPVLPIAQGPVWLCGCNLSSLIQKLFIFHSESEPFGLPSYSQKCIHSKPFHVRDVFPLSICFVSFSLCSFRNDGFAWVFPIGVELCTVPLEMWVSPLAQIRYVASPINYKLPGSRGSLGTSYLSGLWFVICICLFY